MVRDLQKWIGWRTPYKVTVSMATQAHECPHAYMILLCFRCLCRFFNEPFTESSNDAPDMIMKMSSQGYTLSAQEILTSLCSLQVGYQYCFPLPFILLCLIELLRNTTRNCITTGSGVIEMWSQTGSY